MREVTEALRMALQHHQAGRWAQAEAIYREVLAAMPGQAEALDLLGALLAQTRRAEEGIAILREAVAADPRRVSAWMNLGLLLRGRDALEEALGCYRRVVEIDPGHAFAHNQMGEMLKATGHAAEALAAFERAAALKPDYAKALHNLAGMLAAKERFEAAAALCRRVLALQPGFVEGYTNLGNALAGLRQFTEAIACYEHVLRLKPGESAARINLGHALAGAGRFGEAVACYEAALREPLAAREQGAVCLQLGSALMEEERLEESVAAYRRAVALCPGEAEGHRLLAMALKGQGKLEEALGCVEESLRLKPGSVEGQQSRGALLTAMGRLEESIAIARRLAEEDPGNAGLGSSLLGTLQYSPRYTQEMLGSEARVWAARHADGLLPATVVHANERSPGRRLRVGYVSPDFHGHPVGFNLLPLFKAHDRAAVEVICYAQEAHPDAVTAEFQRLADGWREMQGVSDEVMAERIRADGIDILVDLALHTAGNRLLVLARKPAPVQVTWAGYPGTTGMRAIDYRLTDPHLDPPGDAEGGWSVEEAVRLETFWCYDPLAHLLAVNELPVLKRGSAGGGEGAGVTFGCLNNFCKVNEGMVTLWARVMRAVPGSRLMLLAGEGRHRSHTAALFEREGVRAERIVFEVPRPRIKYLELYHQVDIGLDTLPYNGHTTSLDSYWMGVPVVTLVGETIAGRAGLSQLSNLGLGELAGRTGEAFVEIAVGLARDTTRLAELRRTLRERMRGSPLMDGARFARRVEGAYRRMWERWCAGA